MTTLKKIVRNGNCFQSSLDALIFKGNNWKLVHGVAILTGGEFIGSEFAHAWLEQEKWVYNADTDVHVLKEIFYQIGQIGHTVKYTKEEAMRVSTEYGHYGPWDNEISKAL